MSEDKESEASSEVVLDETNDDVIPDAVEKIPVNSQWAKGNSNRARHVIDQFFEEKRLKRLVDDVFDDRADA